MAVRGRGWSAVLSGGDLLVDAAAHSSTDSPASEPVLPSTRRSVVGAATCGSSWLAGAVASRSSSSMSVARPYPTQWGPPAYPGR